MFHSCGKEAGWFFCGNFGMVLINSAWTEGSHAKDILQKMIEVTMMRGAQSGGVVTYVQSGRSRCKDLRGVRSRVLNGKRTDLSKLVRAKLDRSERRNRILRGRTKIVRVFAGHTRFATTSLSTFAGTHPHQWSPPRTMGVYTGFNVGVLEYETRNCENFISHNGDLDAFDICGTIYPLEVLQQWLPRVTGCPLPAPVDSVVIAGLIDCLRTQGNWILSVRYGFLFGSGHMSLDYAMPSA
jgi:hypothetical protein